MCIVGNSPLLSLQSKRSCFPKVDAIKSATVDIVSHFWIITFISVNSCTLKCCVFSVDLIVHWFYRCHYTIYWLLLKWTVFPAYRIRKETCHVDMEGWWLFFGGNSRTWYWMGSGKCINCYFMEWLFRHFTITHQILHGKIIVSTANILGSLQRMPLKYDESQGSWTLQKDLPVIISLSFLKFRGIKP